MEPSTRRLRADKYPANPNTKYITTHRESHYLEVADTREQLNVSDEFLELFPSETDMEFLSDDVKFLFKVDFAFYHFFIDSLPVILKLHGEHPSLLIILYLQNSKQSKLSSEIKELLQVILDGEGVNYKFIEIAEDAEYANIIKINNYAIVDQYFSGNNSTSLYDVRQTMDLVIKYSREFLGLEATTSAPNKRVFLVGRSPTTPFELVLDDPDSYDGYLDDERMYEREKLENFFSELGYELIDPARDFDSLFHQVVYFNQVKVLAAVTCSGLANMAFMEPNQTVIEIQAEIVQNMPLDNGEPGSKPFQSIHTMYPILTFMKDHVLVSVPSHRDPGAVIQKLKSQEIINIL